MCVTATNLIKSYGNRRVLDGISLHVPAGRILGLLGPNGAGKSTTLRILTGSMAPDSGEVRIGKSVMAPGRAKLRQRIGYLPEHNPLYPDMYIAEYLRFVARLHGLTSSAQRNNRIEEVMAMTGLEPERNKPIHQLSKGYRQRVGLAQAILHDPDVLILDEPTSGLDPHQLIEIRQLIRQLGQKKAVVLSTHIMQEVEAVCDDLAIIHEGRIVAQCPLHQLQAQYGTADIETLFIQVTSPFSSRLDGPEDRLV